MRGARAETIHFWMFAISCAALTSLVLVGMLRSGVFDSHTLEDFDTSSLVRPAPKDPGPVVVVVNNTPDESDCLEIVVDGSSRPIVDQVVSSEKLRKLPEIEEASFEQQMREWRDREAFRLTQIQQKDAHPILYEPSPEDILRFQRVHKQNEIESAAYQRFAEAEFSVIEQRDRNRKDLHREAMEREKRLAELRAGYSTLTKID